MKGIPQSLSRTFAKQILMTQKHSPSILFGVGVVGFIGTTVLACKATLKVDEVLEETNKALANTNMYATVDGINDQQLQRRKMHVYANATRKLVILYGPTCICGFVSVAALTKSHSILNKRNAAINAAYAAMAKGFADYRQRVIDDVGEEKEREYKYPLEEITEDVNGKSKTVKRVGEKSRSIYARFFDQKSSSWSPQPEYNTLFLRCQQNHLNDQLRARGHVFLNEAYDALGIDRTKEGAVVGWIWDGNGDNYIDFGIFNQRMEPQHFEFFTGQEGAILLDFNVDGIIFDKIG